RVVARFHLLPLDKSDVANYVNHRLHHAGANRAIFESAAMTALFKLTKGVPRLINLICHHALLAAYATGAKTVSAQLVKKSAVEIFDTHLPKKKSSGKGLIALFIVGIFALLMAEQHIVDKPTDIAPEKAEIIAPIEPEIEEQAQPLIEIVQPEEILIEPTNNALEEELEVLQTQISQPKVTNSFAALFANWSIEVEALFSEEEVYAFAAENDLGAEKLTDSDISILTAIDRPGVVWITEDNGRLKSYLLTGLNDQLVLVKSADGERLETIDWFSKQWNGTFLYLWHSPLNFQSLGLGDQDVSALEWLQSKLQAIDSDYLPLITDGYYTEAVRDRVLAFQKQQAIQADGVVGRQTIMKLNQLTNPETPKLSNTKILGDNI
ncbi:MAG: peptidoglycan-binding protein, partial [Porticoccaceae bacterium]